MWVRPMLKAKAEVGRLPDGVLTLYADSAERFEVGIDWSTTYGLTKLYELAFRSQQFRAKDVELLGADASQITRKVACRLSPSLDTEKLAEIGGKVYEVTRTDNDGRWHYLYLTELACDGTCDLVGYTTTRVKGEQKRSESVTTVHVKVATAGEIDTDDVKFESLWPTIALTVRACDYNRQTVVRRGSMEYHVSKVTGDGEWVKLNCTGGVPYGQR